MLVLTNPLTHDKLYWLFYWRPLGRLFMGVVMRSVYWDDTSNMLNMIDQRRLPAQLEVKAFADHFAVADAINNMTVRGAPAIGAAAGFGLALAGFNSSASEKDEFHADLQKAAAELVKTRPTAVNLSWAINSLLTKVMQLPGNVKELQQELLAAAKAMADADIEINKKLAQYGADLIQDGDNIVHHCNTGALAVVDWGTAIGVIRTAFEQGKRIHVFVDETRPRLQGSRLTAWELEQYGIPYDIITDSASGYLIRSGQVQKVLFGADRVTANGDVANKIGTYMLALAAYDNGIPAYSVFPTSTVDLSLECGDQIEIEERHQMEVLNIQINGEQVSPTGASARNPAFDITPNRLISALVTEKGVIYPPYIKNLSAKLKA